MKTEKYILWNPSSDLPPRVPFFTEEDATKAARNMAASNPGESFYVMRAVSISRTDAPKVVTTPYREAPSKDGLHRVAWLAGGCIVCGSGSRHDRMYAHDGCWEMCSKKVHDAAMKWTKHGTRKTK